MSRKLIKIKHLVPGMFVDTIDCGTHERQRIGETSNFLIISQKEVDRLVALGVAELYINTEKGLDLTDEKELRREASKIMVDLARMRDAQTVQKPKTLADELYEAKNLLAKSCAELENAIAKLRAGEQVDIRTFWPLLNEIYESVNESRDAIVTVCRKKKKGGYALEHLVSHCALMIAFGQTLGMEKDAILELGLGGLFHDIGKIRIPEAILDKPGKLTDEELTVAQQHAALGGEILKNVSNFPEKAMAVVMEHHERIDGTGYPKQLKDNEISLFGQMASIVDVYDACISIRAYGGAADPCQVIRQLFEKAGKLFHKELVQQFIKTIGIFPVGTLVRLDNDKLAIVIRQTKSLTQPMVRVVYDLKQNCFIPPEDIDLSRPRPKMIKVAGHEKPEKWNINPFSFISPELAKI